MNMADLRAPPIETVTAAAAGEVKPVIFTTWIGRNTADPKDYTLAIIFTSTYTFQESGPQTVTGTVPLDALSSAAQALGLSMTSVVEISSSTQITNTSDSLASSQPTSTSLPTSQPTNPNPTTSTASASASIPKESTTKPTEPTTNPTTSSSSPSSASASSDSTESTLPSGPSGNKTPVIIAGALVGALVTFGLLAALFLFRKRRRRYDRNRQKSLLEKDLPIESLGGGVSPAITTLSIASSQVPLLAIPPSRPAPDAPLDDSAILKLFNEMDGRITDHVINWWHTGDVNSPQYQEYVNSQAAQDARAKVLYQGKPLLLNPDTRIPMLRAQLAYHVYTALADWRLLTTDQQAKLSQVPAAERVSYRSTLCMDLEKSTENVNKRVDFIYSLLDRDTKLHIAPEKKDSKLAKESLRKIVRSVVTMSLTLGIQPNEFKFDFRNKDYKGDVAKDLLAVRVLGETDVEGKMMEMVNGTPSGGKVRAVISPGVIRVPRSGTEYLMRRVKVFVA